MSIVQTNVIRKIWRCATHRRPLDGESRHPGVAFLSTTWHGNSLHSSDVEMHNMFPPANTAYQTSHIDTADLGQPLAKTSHSTPSCGDSRYHVWHTEVRIAPTTVGRWFTAPKRSVCHKSCFFRIISQMRFDLLHLLKMKQSIAVQIQSKCAGTDMLNVTYLNTSTFMGSRVRFDCMDTKIFNMCVVVIGLAAWRISENATNRRRLTNESRHLGVTDPLSFPKKKIYKLWPCRLAVRSITEKCS